MLKKYTNESKKKLIKNYVSFSLYGVIFRKTAYFLDFGERK